jgi:hypothetical protein
MLDILGSSKVSDKEGFLKTSFKDNAITTLNVIRWTFKMEIAEVALKNQLRWMT